MALLPLAGSAGSGTATTGPQILWVRNGVTLQEWVGSATTPAQFGTQLTAALAEPLLTSGDELRLSNFVAEGNGWTLADNGVKLICEHVTLRPLSVGVVNYAQLFNVTGNDCEIIGLIVDGKALANAGDGAGIRCSGDRCHFRNIEAHRTRGGAGSNPSALVLQGADDVVVDGYRSVEAGYASVRLVGNMRATVNNVYIKDPINRALNLEGTGNYERAVFNNWEAEYLTPIGQAGVFVNFNVDGMVDRVEMTNCHFYNADVWGAGFSYNEASPLQMVKMHGVRRAKFTNCTWWHGENLTLAPGGVRYAAPTFRFPGPGEGPTPEEVTWENCMFASNISFTTTDHINKIRLINCEVGVRACYNSAPLLDLRVKDFTAEACRINMHQRTTAIRYHSGTLSTDRSRVTNCRFTFNPLSPTTGYVFNGSDGVAPRSAIGNFIVHSNTVEYPSGSLLNIGFGAITHLLARTDPNGDMLWDSTLSPPPPATIGSDDLPYPWTGYTGTAQADPLTGYFPSVPIPITKGRRIINQTYTPLAAANTVNAIKAWVVTGGVWQKWV